MPARLITEIGIQNYKTINTYTLVPIRDITVLIGKNGSGKSSCWQVLHLLDCFNPAKYQISPEEMEAYGIHPDIDLRNFKEYGVKAESLLFDVKEPLIIELFSKLTVASEIIKEEELIFRFEFLTAKDDSILEISKFSVFAKNGRELLFECEFNMREGISSCTHADFFEQYLLNILFKIKEKKFEKKSGTRPLSELFSKAQEVLDKTKAFVEDKPDSFFESELRPQHIKEKWGRANLSFAVLFNDTIEFENIDTDLLPDEELAESVDFVYQCMKETLEELLTQAKNILFVNRKLIGHPTRFITKTPERENLLDLSNHRLDKAIDFIKGRLQYFNFRDFPIFEEDESGTLFLLKQGKEDMRNTGSGYWSITYIMYAILNAINYDRKIIVYEEPEAHLHPDFQAALADFLVEASIKFNITLILETHSEYITRRMQLRVFAAHNEVAETKDPLKEIQTFLKYSNPYNVKLDKDRIIINYFKHITERNEKEPTCLNITIDENGMLNSEYPLTFAGVANADAQLLFNLRNKY